ncbi:Transthyretin-like family protein [Ancylostoma caninum]|uniref:Transthyretin-like family protein n=1 Tax=Ancylostoma caninum TaxID=29170 RepID=A0A368GEB0_ANCCA|nr:Transthyretin-like family protein [Ancylostoma caninum]
MAHLEIFNLQMRVVILLLLISSCYGLLWFNQMQSVGVKGKLVCNGKPAEGVKVKLYEKEICKNYIHAFYVFDRKLDQGKTGAHGEFKLWGSAREISNIDPQLNIYHKCNHRGIVPVGTSPFLKWNLVILGSYPVCFFQSD